MRGWHTGAVRNRPPAIEGLAASRLQLPPGPWATVLEGLCARFRAVPRAQWLDRMARGRVLDSSGRPLAPDTPYRVGLEVHYYREVAEEPRIPFEETVLHADGDLLVADKPHFLPVAPTGAHVHETLLGRLIRRTGNPGLVPLHRIDRDTAGLVLFSANPRTWLPVPAEWAALTVERQTPDPGSTLNFFRELIRLRRSTFQFADNDVEWVRHTRTVLHFRAGGVQCLLGEHREVVVRQLGESVSTKYGQDFTGY